MTDYNKPDLFGDTSNVDIPPVDAFGNLLPADNSITSAPTTPDVRSSKIDRLASRNAQKLERLKARAGLSLADKSDSYAVLEGGNESMRNKIVNDYDPAVLDYFATRMNNEFGVVNTSEGLMRQDAQGNLTPYEGDASTLSSFYTYRTKDGGIKHGVWGGLNPADRYADEYLARNKDAIGPSGVDVDQLERHYIMPVSNNELLEALIHGNDKYLQNRAVRYAENSNVEDYRAARDVYGSGATEIYRNFDTGALPEGFDGDAAWNEFVQKYRPETRGRLTPEEQLDYDNARAAALDRGVDENFLNRSANVGKGVAATATRSLLVDTADLLGDVTGIYDIGTADEKRAMTNELFGYNSVFADEAAAEAKRHVTKLYEAYKNNGEMDMDDVYGAIAAGFTPELLAESLTETVALFLGVSKFTKTGKAISSVEKAYKAGTIPASAAKAAVTQIKKDASLIDMAKLFVAGNAGYLSQVANVTNDTVDVFKENNDGQVGVSDVARMAAVNALALGIDRFSAAITMRDIPGVPSVTDTLNKFLPGGTGISSKERSDLIKKAVEELTPQEYVKVARAAMMTVATAGKITGDAAVEGVTEYVQTLAEVFNEQYATEKYGTDVAKILLSDQAQIEALTGASLGVGMGISTSATGSAFSAAGSVAPEVLARVGRMLPAADTTTASAPEESVTTSYVQPISDVEAEDQRLADKYLYDTTLTRLHNARVSESGLKAESLGDYLNDIEVLKRTRYALTDSAPERLAAADEALRRIERDVKTIIDTHPDGKIKFSSVFSGENVLGSSNKSDKLPDNVRKALVEAVTDLVARYNDADISAEVITKLQNLATTNEVPADVVDKVLKSYSTVEEEATIGDRGTIGRARNLDLLLASGNATAPMIRKLYNEASDFYVTTKHSIEALQQGIKEAGIVAATQNKSVKPESTSKAIPITTSYLTDVNSTSGGKPFVIYVRYKDGKWVADTAEATKRISAKEGTAAGLRSLLNKFSTEASDFLNEDFVVPVLDDVTAEAASVVEPVPAAEPTKVETQIEPTVEPTVEPVAELTDVTTDVTVPTKPETVAEKPQPASKKPTKPVVETEQVNSSPKARTRLASLAIEYRLAELGFNGRSIEEIGADISKARKQAEKFFKYSAVKGINREIPSEDIDVSDIDANTELSPEERDLLVAQRVMLRDLDNVLNDRFNAPVTRSAKSNMTDYMNAAFEAATKAVAEWGESVGESDYLAGTSSLQILGEALTNARNRQEEISSAFVEGWNKAALGKLSGNALIGALNDALRKVGAIVKSNVNAPASQDTVIELRKEAKDLLDNMIGTTYRKNAYVIRGTTVRNGSTVTVEITKFAKTSNTVIGGTIQDKTHGSVQITDITEVVLNPTEYLTVNKTTPMNTLSTETLPKVFKDGIEAIRESLREILPVMTQEERNFIPNSGKLYWAAESPARAFIFDKDGSIPDVIMNAMNIALADMVFTDISTLVQGPKDTATIAKMFKVADFEVTDEMVKIANERGALAKTVANKLGKSMLGTLGIARAKDSNVTRGHFERLATDLGNIILEVARDQGIVDMTSLNYDTLGTLIGGNPNIFDSSDTSKETLTWFVSIPTEETTQGIKPVMQARNIRDDYREMTSFVSSITGSVKAPFYGTGVPKKVRERALSEMRNNIAGGAIPLEAKKALGLFMDTPYEINTDSVKTFFELMEDPEIAYGIKKSMGYVSTERVDPQDPNSAFVDEAYEGMLYDDKLVQEAINSGIDKSIEYLREGYEVVQNGGTPNELYFAFFYTTNHRYMVDSNTINPQGDKLHRFFVQPKGHKTTYKVNKKTGTFETSVTTATGTETKDVSLYVRAALAQAFGIGIDKTSTADIVDVGNTLLSIPEEDLESVRDAMLRDGKMVLNVEGTQQVFKLDHVSHFLSAIDFLMDYHDAGETMVSNLSAETDALTSGFSNKIQQFASFNSTEDVLTTHSRRVGVIRNVDNSKDVGMFSNGSAYGMNDMLASKGMVDSYQNLAKTVLVSIEENKDSLSAYQQKMLDVLTPLLPGLDQVGKVDKVISGALRNMFKPGFMIFNYSAGVNRIVKNLSSELVNDVVRLIAKADLSDKESAEYAAAKMLADTVGVSVNTLQNTLKTAPLDSLRVELKVRKNGKFVVNKIALQDYLNRLIIEPTYGSAVKTAFEDNFEHFSRIQNVTNDAFRVTFALFENALTNKLKELKAGGTTITEQTFKDTVASLKKDFPVIAGPLSNSLNEGVHIYSIDTRSTTNTVGAAVARINGTNKTRKLQPIIKSMVAAANAGAVLPFHAIDGAQMAKTVNEFYSQSFKNSNGVPVVPIHDAVIAPLAYLDEVAYIYNSETVDINSNYSIMEELVRMMDNAAKNAETAEGLPPVDNLSIRNGIQYEDRRKEVSELKSKLRIAKTLEQKKVIRDQIDELNRRFSFTEDFTNVRAELNVLAKITEEARQTYYTPGTKVSAMVGLAGSVYTVGESTPNKFTETLTKLYRPVEVTTPFSEVDTWNNERSIDSVLEERFELDKAGDEVKWEGAVERSKVATKVLSASNTRYTSNDVVLVKSSDKVNSQDNMELEWLSDLEEAETALRSNAALVFGDKALNNEDLSDPAYGETFVYSRLMDNDQYDSYTTDVNGELVVVVVKKELNFDSEQEGIVANSDESGIIGSLNNNKRTSDLASYVNRLKELSKRCKE